MAKMKAVQVREAGGDFELVERDMPEPPAGEVRIRVEACGICHSDVFTKEGLWPGIEFPRVPGHEVVGRVDAVGHGVSALQEGQRVGVGWHANHCFVCDACREGDFLMCAEAGVTGITRDGGYSEHMLARAEAVAFVPDALESASAAPLLCAGVTVFNALRHTGARPGDLVAIQGVGGLGHLAIQYASRAGHRTVAISGTRSKEKLARELGAHEFIAADEEDAAEALQKMGGARVLVATAPDAKLMGSVLEGLGRNGEMVIVGATPEPVPVPPLALISARRSIRGWPSGHARDSQDTLELSALAGITAQIETFPLEKASEAYARMLSNEARFRAVLTMG